MSGQDVGQDELGRLTAALCDGEIAPEEVPALERMLRDSPQARRFFLQYVQLHGELHWEHAAGARSRPATPVLPREQPSRGVAAPPLPTLPVPGGRRPRRSRLAWLAAGVLFLLLIGVIFAWREADRRPPQRPRPEPAALAPASVPPAGEQPRPQPHAGSPSEFNVAAFRRLVAIHPNLIHHYPFEGTTRQEKRHDACDQLHLIESVMLGGRSRGDLDYTAVGFDATTEAIRPLRGLGSGNTTGVALQSEVRFQPPRQMTVELLVRLDLPAESKEELIAVAVGTRAADPDCGFLVAAVGDGELTYLLDAEAPWPEGHLQFVSGHWYYVALAFDAGAGSTVVNAYAADLSEGQRRLRQVVVDDPAPGTPAASRLGIGKGFDETGAHAYPWPGAIDEVAIYDAVLGIETLQGHLEAILGPPPGD